MIKIRYTKQIIINTKVLIILANCIQSIATRDLSLLLLEASSMFFSSISSFGSNSVNITYFPGLEFITRLAATIHPGAGSARFLNDISISVIRIPANVITMESRMNNKIMGVSELNLGIIYPISVIKTKCANKLKHISISLVLSLISKIMPVIVNSTMTIAGTTTSAAGPASSRRNVKVYFNIG